MVTDSTNFSFTMTDQIEIIDLTSPAMPFNEILRLLNIDTVRVSLFNSLDLTDLFNIREVFYSHVNHEASHHIDDVIKRAKEEVLPWVSSIMNMDMKYCRTRKEETMMRMARLSTPLDAVHSIRCVIWDSSIPIIPPGLRWLQELRSFSYRNYSAMGFQTRQIHNIKTSTIVILPTELCLCKKLRFLDLSFAQFKEIPSSWRSLTELRELNLSFNKSLTIVPHWLGLNNHNLRRLDVMGCTALSDVSLQAIRRLNNSSLCRRFRPVYDEIYAVLCRYLDGIDTTEVDWHFDVRMKTVWSFCESFRFLMQQRFTSRFRRQLSCVLCVSKNSSCGQFMHQLYKRWADSCTGDYDVKNVLHINIGRLFDMGEQIEDFLYGNICRMIHTGFVLFYTFDEVDDGSHSAQSTSANAVHVYRDVELDSNDN